MIAKNDIILLLTELEQNNIDVKDDIQKVLSSKTIPFDVLKKINDYKTLDVLAFYEKLRKSYNNKKSKLFMNIMKADENVLDDPKTILTTLSALLNQILQFNAENKVMFYSHMRCDEITKVLEIYFKTYNLTSAIELLKLFKADCKVTQMLK